MHFLKPGLGGHAPEHVSVLRENQPGSKRRKTKVNFIYWRRESETGECRGLLSCLPCPCCVGIGPGLLPWLCGAPQAPRSAQLPWPGPAELPWLCAGSSGARVCPAPLAQPCPDGPTASPLERSHLSASECLTSCSITSLFREKVALVDTRL